MFKPSGLLLAFATMLLQIAVFLQPLLPEQYQIAPVCETISDALWRPTPEHIHSQVALEDRPLIQQIVQSGFKLHFIQQDRIKAAQVAKHSQQGHQGGHDHHDLSHQCQYCTVYGNLVLPTEFGIKEILVRIQVRLLAYIAQFNHVYFELQQLYLIPQSRAPPVI
ncbi:hypothetical protein EC844_11332 [Acinetobacter calcoaceticus]|uniref:DUF2946 family protein n=1 Tax=Acinetobacter calcoaceticus TaxID=471 RepID=A0A4R1XT63_ACICA|nr:hypothetical protein EC844_11332 [Acinetobacter calcoaceticus]